MTAQPDAPQQKQLLIINPNTTVAVTDRLKQMAQAALGTGAHIHAVTAPFGAPYISTEVACAVAAHATLEAWRLHRAASGRVDGILIGCFGDPGLFALREAAGVPVTGLAEAAFTQAQAQGPYAVVTGGKPWLAMLRRLALALPAGQHLKDMEAVELDGAALSADTLLGEQIVIDACRKVLARSTVHSIIIGGAGLAGWARRLQPHVAVPLIDSVEAGLHQLQLMSTSTNHTA